MDGSGVLGEDEGEDKNEDESEDVVDVVGEVDVEMDVVASDDDESVGLDGFDEDEDVNESVACAVDVKVVVAADVVLEEEKGFVDQTTFAVSWAVAWTEALSLPWG